MNQHDTLTLEPCPFCGAQPEQCDVGDHVVTCPSCGVDGPYGAPSGVAGAIQGWNRRAALSATQPAAGADVVPEHVALLNEKVRELEARDAFEAQNKCSLGFKRSARGTYVNPPVARDWKWFRLGVQHANKDAS